MMPKRKHNWLCLILVSVTPSWSLAQTPSSAPTDDTGNFALSVTCGAEKNGLSRDEFHECLMSMPSDTFKDLSSIYNPLIANYKYYDAVSNSVTSYDDQGAQHRRTLWEYDSRNLLRNVCFNTCHQGMYGATICAMFGCKWSNPNRRRLGGPFFESIDDLMTDALEPGLENILKSAMIAYDESNGYYDKCSKVLFKCIAKVCENYVDESMRVTTLRLIDALTNNNLGELTSGTVIDKNQGDFKIVAETKGDVASVYFGSDFTSDMVHSETKPFSMNEPERRRNRFLAAEEDGGLSVGKHTMTVVPYSSDRVRGKPFSVFFNIIDTYKYPTDFKVSGFTINFSHGQPIRNLVNGDVVALDQLSDNISVMCHTLGKRQINEIDFYFDHVLQETTKESAFEVNVPKSLIGDTIRPGMHWLHVVPKAYTADGELEKGATVSLIFDVVVPDPQDADSNTFWEI